MKKIYTYLTLFMLALSPAMLTSCDNDDPWYDDYYGWYEDEDDRYNKPYDQGSDQLVDMAQTLNGMWRGEAKNVVYEDNVAYETKIFVDFTFTQYSRNSNNGVGYETDYAQAYDKNGNPLYNTDGSPVYDNQTMQFKWYIDPRTYNIYMEYVESGAKYLLDFNGNTDDSGFMLGWSDKYNKEIFDGVMEGINVDERVYFSCDRANNTRAASGTATTNTRKLSFGKGKGVKLATEGLKSELPKR
ncbi:hypothetical protein [uncultured Prevotella sp.]|uniref:hypothetical protein n=1 Tax=Prevotella merdae TaxID=2079531 RepID=UPI0027E3094A|nr:hypothetical protein [uncultured Prevotella sp.]